jgi:uncharacterized membrane protein SpoIIM required for sporulation
MNEETMLQQRGRSWRRLQDLTAKAGHSFRKLDDAELDEFVRLYRQASADLAFLTTRSSNESVVQYLNAVVGQAYSQLYREPYRPWGQKVSDALCVAAETVRRRAWAFALAFGIFLAAIFTSAGLLAYSDDYRDFYIPQDPGMRESFEAWKTGDMDPRTGGEGVMATAFYASNNPKVSIITNAVSLVSFGVMTAVLLWANGTMMGALSYEMVGVGKLDHLLTWVAPHGVTELGGIFMAGAGGFVLAAALIAPGRRSRGQALKIAGKDAFVFAMLSVIMTLLAAPVEGFFSFDPRVPDWLKLVFAGATLAGWLAFFIWFGRGRQSIECAEQPAR